MKVNYRSFIFGFVIVIATFISVVVNNSLGCRLAVLFLFVSCIIKGRKEKYLLNVYYLFAITPLSLLIYTNLSTRYMMDLTIRTWILAIINMSAFLIAVNFTPNYKSVGKCIGTGQGRKLSRNSLILTFVGCLPSIYRSIFGSIMPLASIFSLFITVGLICALRSKNKKIIILVLALLVLSRRNYVNKSFVLSVLLGLLIGYEKYFVKSKRQKAKLVVLSSLGLLFMIFAFTFANKDRGVISAQEAVSYYTRYGGVIWNRSNVLFMPYMYLTTAWGNLQHVIETQNTRTYGLWMLKPLLGYLQIDRFFSGQYSLKAYSSFNTFTYIAVQFKDFGYWGSIIPSVFLGIFAKKIYSRFTISRSPLDVACYVLVGQAVLQMFFSNEFFSQSFPFSVVIIMGLYKYFFCRGNEIELEDGLSERNVEKIGISEYKII